MKITVVVTLLWGIGIGLITLGIQVGQWERENGYPYGKMCNSIFTGYVNTCK